MSLKVKNIGIFKYKSDKFVSMSFSFFDTNVINRPIYAYIHRELHSLEGLKVNLLVGNNILATKIVVINLVNKIAIISNCQIIIAVIARLRG